LAAGKCVTVLGRNEEGDWVLVTYEVNKLIVEDERIVGEQSGWVSTKYLIIDGDVKQLSVVHGNTSAFAHQINPITLQLRKNAITELMYFVIDDPKYDENTSVLHKYKNSISIDLDEITLTFTVLGEIANEDDFLSLSYDLILLGIVVSEPGTENDWGLQRIEVISPGPSDSFAKFYIEGTDNILGIAEKQIDVIDALETDVSYGTWKTPTLSPNKTSTPRPPTQVSWKTNTPAFEYILCGDTKSKSGSYVSCEIPRAYCSYQPKTRGSPTFCNDARYPNHNFTLVVWESDWSYLDGSCILVSGRVLIYQGKPQIEVSSQNQVTICP
jgi:hypothetical protein